METHLGGSIVFDLSDVVEMVALNQLKALEASTASFVSGRLRFLICGPSLQDPDAKRREDEDARDDVHLQVSWLRLTTK